MSARAGQLDCLGRQLLSNREEAPRRERKRWKRLISPLFLFLVLVVQLWIRLSIINQGYRLEAVRRDVLRNDNTLRELHLQHAYLTRPAALQLLAKDRLGMVPLTPQRIRKVNQWGGGDV